MNKDDIIRMAREVGLLPDNSHPAPQTRHMTEKQACIERFAALVAAAERESCAKVCEENATDLSEGDWDSACINCADHIRARGQK